MQLEMHPCMYLLCCQIKGRLKCRVPDIPDRRITVYIRSVIRLEAKRLTNLTFFANISNLTQPGRWTVTYADTTILLTVPAAVCRTKAFKSSMNAA